MARLESPYKKISLEEAVIDEQSRRDIRALNREGWESEMARARLDIASKLAFGLLRLFFATVICSAVILTVLVVGYTVSGKPTSELEDAIDQAMSFVTMLLPYIATPLGIALGYFFSEAD